MTFTVVSTAPPCRVTLLDASGAPAFRWTLQVTQNEGRTLRWTPDGVLHQGGSATAFARTWTHRGLRHEIALRWSAGLISSRETWTGTDWSEPEYLPTAYAHSQILSWSAPFTVMVEPFMDDEFGVFTAQASESGPSLKDTRGLVHKDLELVLVQGSPATATGLPDPNSPDEDDEGWGYSGWGWYSWDSVLGS